GTLVRTIRQSGTTTLFFGFRNRKNLLKALISLPKRRRYPCPRDVDIPAQETSIRPCAGPGRPPAGGAARSPRRPPRSIRPGKRRAGSVPPCRHGSPSPRGRG